MVLRRRLRGGRCRCRRFGVRRRRRRPCSGRRRGDLGQGSTQSTEGEPERGRLGLRRLCRRRLRQVSTPDVQEVGLASLLQQRQVRSQPLKLLLLFIPELLLLVTLSIAVLRGVVFGAPLGLIVAATALLAFPLLPPLRTALLHLLGAVALEVPVLLALVALIGA